MVYRVIVAVRSHAKTNGTAGRSLASTVSSSGDVLKGSSHASRTTSTGFTRPWPAIRRTNTFYRLARLHLNSFSYSANYSIVYLMKLMNSDHISSNFQSQILV